MGGDWARAARAAGSLSIAALLLSCAASAPPEPSTGSATAWGFLRLVPREEVAPRAPRGDRLPRAAQEIRVGAGEPASVVVRVGAEGEAGPAAASPGGR